jgi:hypothetical protein
MLARSHHDAARPRAATSFQSIRLPEFSGVPRHHLGPALIGGAFLSRRNIFGGSVLASAVASERRFLSSHGLLWRAFMDVICPGCGSNASQILVGSDGNNYAKCLDCGEIQLLTAPAVRDGREEVIGSR